MVVVLEPSAEQLDSIQQTLQDEGGLTSDGFATGPLPGALDDPQDPNQVVLSLGGVSSDGTVIPTSLHIENFDRVAVFQEQLREAGIEGGSEAFNTLVRTFDQNRNDNLREFDPNDENIDEVAELFAGTDLLAASDDLGSVTVLQPSTEQIDAIQANLESDAGGLTRDGFATGTVPRELEDIGNPNQVILSLGGTASDGTEIPPSLQIENLEQLATFQAAIRDAGIEDASETFNTLVRTFDQNRNGVLQEFDADAAADVSALFAGTDLLDGAAVAEDDGDDAEDDGDDAGADDGGEAVAENDGNEAAGNTGAGGADLISFSPNADQLSVIREDLEGGDTAGLSVDNFAVGEIPAELRDADNPNAVLVTEGGTDAEGNEVPASLLFDPAVLERQANIRIALEEAFPDDAETRNLLQRQFDQVRNDNLQPFEVGDDVGDVTAIFDGLDLPGSGEAAVAEADDSIEDAGDDIIVSDNSAADDNILGDDGGLDIGGGDAEAIDVTGDDADVYYDDDAIA